jgi:hypothetical protein
LPALGVCDHSTVSTGEAAAPGSVTGGGPLTLTELAVKMKAGSSLTSAHFTVAAKVGNTSILNAKGDETLADGKLTAIRMNERVGSLNVAVIMVDQTVYVSLPGNVNQSANPPAESTRLRSAAGSSPRHTSPDHAVARHCPQSRTTSPIRNDQTRQRFLDALKDRVSTPDHR